MQTLTGIDLSHHNGRGNWVKVKANGVQISFAYIKATQGVGYKDPACISHATGATGVGIKVGYYHFASLNNNLDPVKDAADEAAWFHSVIKTLPSFQLVPVLDIETNDKKLTTLQVQQWLNSFLHVIKKLGHDRIALYSYKPFLDENLPANHTFGNLPLWIAQHRSIAQPLLPRGWNNYALWQYSNKGKVDGINGSCDLNRTLETNFENGLLI
jgi:lysozyme